MKRKTMGWLIVFLLFIVYMLNYMDRSALSITAPLIEKELGFNAAEMGMIFSAFFIGYALFNFIGGWASDKVGPKTVFLIAALLWSVFCGLTGLVTGLSCAFFSVWLKDRSALPEIKSSITGFPERSLPRRSEFLAPVPRSAARCPGR